MLIGEHKVSQFAMGVFKPKVIVVTIMAEASEKVKER